MFCIHKTMSPIEIKTSDWLTYWNNRFLNVWANKENVLSVAHHRFVKRLCLAGNVKRAVIHSLEKYKKQTHNGKMIVTDVIAVYGGGGGGGGGGDDYLFKTEAVRP